MYLSLYFAIQVYVSLHFVHIFFGKLVFHTSAFLRFLSVLSFQVDVIFIHICEFTRSERVSSAFQTMKLQPTNEMLFDITRVPSKKSPALQPLCKLFTMSKLIGTLLISE